VLVTAFWVGTCGLVVAGQGSGLVAAILAAVVGALLINAILISLILGRGHVNRLLLSNDLMTSPAVALYKPGEIREISFGPDPHEDYAEPPLPETLCEATVTFQLGRPVRLIVSASDAARLRAWAAGHDIPVRDPDGYSTRPGGAG
jgi:hypothetical protein